VSTISTAVEIVQIMADKKMRHRLVVDVNLGGTLDHDEPQVEELLNVGLPAKVRDLDLTDIGSTALPRDPDKAHEGPPVIVRNSLRLLPLIKKCNSIRSLRLGNNMMGVEGVALLAKVLRKNSSLTKLDIAFNSIGNEGTVLLAEALKKSKCGLRHLDLSHNAIGDKGMEALASAIEAGVAYDLTKLALKYNNIGSAGCRHLKAALENPQSCPSLRSLKLGNNRIGDPGAAAIAVGLKDGLFKKLDTLDLSNNNITHSGSFKLAEVVKASADLVNLRLNLCSNKLTVGTMRSIESSHRAGLVPRPNLSLSTQVLRMSKAQAIFHYHHNGNHLKNYAITKNGRPLKPDPRERPGHAGTVLFQQWEAGLVDFDHNTSDADITAVLEHLKVKPARMFKAYRLAQLQRALSDYPGLRQAETRELMMAGHNEHHRLHRCHHLKEVAWGMKGKELKSVARVYGSVKGQQKVAWNNVLGEEE
jgi:Ran GTPase-activating protein (RanGAP) involved in mRNA processing and transport